MIRRVLSHFDEQLAPKTRQPLDTLDNGWSSGLGGGNLTSARLVQISYLDLI